MKKRFWIFGAVLAAAVAAAVCVTVLVMPQNFFKSDDRLEVALIQRVNSQNQLVDITDQVDLEFLETYLPLIQCRRFRTQFAPTPLAEYDYEITLRDDTNKRVIHIILGDSDTNYIYLSADRGGYKIYNNDIWLAMMNWLETETDAG